MRLGLIGDVHAEDERLLVALQALTKERVDRILCSGNIVDGRGDVDRTCALLAAHHVTTVRGNHDRWIRDDEQRSVPNAHRMTGLAPASIDVLKSLPPTVTIDLPDGGKLLLCHGVGSNDLRKVGPDDGRHAISTNDDLLKLLFDPSIAIMVGGHTRRPMVKRFERGAGKAALLVVNAGTLVRSESPGFAILDVGARKVEFREIDEHLTVLPSSRAMLSGSVSRTWCAIAAP